MFDLSFGEILIVALGALIFIGPKELPQVMRVVGRGLRKMRAMGNEVKAAFSDVLEDETLSETRKDMNTQIGYIRDESGKLQKTYDISDLIKKDTRPLR